MRHSGVRPPSRGEAIHGSMGAESPTEAQCGACGRARATAKPRLSPPTLPRPTTGEEFFRHSPPPCEIDRACYGSVVVVTWAVAARGAVVSS